MTSREWIIVRTGQIVVGLNETPSGRAALHWAAHQASATGSQLRAVHVLEWPRGRSSFGLSDPAETLRIAPQHLDHAYRRAVTAFFEECTPQEGWRLLFDEGDVAEVLVREAETADLLVVGTRERAAGGKLLAGISSHYCVGHASCPVVSVPVEYLQRELEAGPARRDAAESELCLPDQRA